MTSSFSYAAVNRAIGQQRYLLSGKFVDVEIDFVDVDIDDLAKTSICGHPQAFSSWSKACLALNTVNASEWETCMYSRGLASGDNILLLMY